MTVTIYQEGKLKIISTNLRNAIESKIGAVSTWKFDKLPNDNFDIIYNPEISKLAQILISIDPFGIMILCGILLMTIHVAINFWYRKKKPIKKYSWIVIIGSLFVPYLSFYIFLISYDRIDNLIGVEASKHHGYYVFILFWLPIVFVIYLIIIWIIDWIFCSVLLHKTTIDYFNNYS